MRRAAATGATLAAAAFGAAACGGSEPSPRGGGASTATSPGARVFADTGCGSCHALQAAGSTGTVGPALDGRDYDLAAVQRWVRSGGKGMPAYEDQLSAAEIREVSAFVASASRGG